jgi:hypothetical protein
MRLAGRAMVIFLALAALLPAAPEPAGAARNCTLTRAGEVYCDGGTQPVRVPVTGKVVQLAASGDSTCALTEPGEVYCWAAGGEPDASGDGSFGFNPLVLISIGLALVGAGLTLVRVSGQGARSRAASRHRSAPSLRRSV